MAGYKIGHWKIKKSKKGHSDFFSHRIASGFQGNHFDFVTKLKFSIFFIGNA
jgi:hypothetical protein